MNSQRHASFCIIDYLGSTEIAQQWHLVRYGEPTLMPETGSYLPRETTLVSVSTPFQLTNFISKGNVLLAVSETSSHTNVEAPGIPWFIDYKEKKTIIFRQQVPLRSEVTWVCCGEAVPPKWTVKARFDQAFERVGKFAKLADNWDSYGARSIDKDSISHGISILKRLIELRELTGLDISAPFVAPLSSGGMQIEWEESDRYLEISIAPGSTDVCYFAGDKAKEGQLSLEGSLRSTRALRELLSWFIHGSPEDLARISFEEAYEESKF